MIGYAIQKGNRVEIYNENGAMMHNYEGMLQGFSATSVVIKTLNCNQISVYDKNGCHIRTCSS